jgi:hypothetical protein
MERSEALRFLISVVLNKSVALKSVMIEPYTISFAGSEITKSLKRLW